MLLGVKARFGHLGRYSHANAIGESLAQRAGAGFYARREAVFRVAGRLALELTKGLQLFQGQIKAEQV